MEAALHLMADLDQSIKIPIIFQTASNHCTSASSITAFSILLQMKNHSEGTYVFFDLVMMKYKSKETVSTAVPVSAIFGVLMVMLAQTKT